MQIKKAQYSGFCPGVKRAVEAVEKCLDDGKNVFTLGEIIHNKHVNLELAQKGAKTIQSVFDAPKGATVIIRSHGVPPKVHKDAEGIDIELIDATCPFVKRIHNKVKESDGRLVIVIGKADHPEVAGIVGWSMGKTQVISSLEDANNFEGAKSALIVAQTTIGVKQFEEIVCELKNKIEDAEIFNSICDTTSKRQEEAVSLSKICDTMVVVGDKNSSNTCQLEKICSKICKNTIFIEDIGEQALEKIHMNGIIGVVAGASTPNCKIMEVITRMSELEKKAVENQEDVVASMEENDQSFAEAFEKTLVRIRNGQIIKGTVVQIVDDEVCVNIGYKSDGFIPRNEFSSDSDVKPSEAVKVGDEIEVEVLKVNDGDGNVLLSAKSVESKKAWENFVAEIDSDPDKIFETVVKEVVKGGIIAYIDGVRTFIPASQVSNKYVEKLDEFVGKTIKVRVIETDKQKKRVVASHKVVLNLEAASKKKEIWDNIQVSTTVKGVVRRLTDFGAFVDIGGVDGLVHVTELAWGRVKHPSDVVKINDEIEVVILSADPEKERISLGYKQLLPKPWFTASERYPVGTIVEGKVVRIVPFGAFVSLEPTIDGLVHISQVATKRIAKVEDELKIGDIITCKVLEVNQEAKRISLSRREVLLDELPIEDIVIDEGDYSANDAGALEIAPVEPATSSLADFFPKLD